MHEQDDGKDEMAQRRELEELLGGDELEPELEVPSQRMRARFDLMLDAVSAPGSRGEPRRDAWSWRALFGMPVAHLASMTAGLVLGVVLLGDRGDPDAELDALRAEVASLQVLVTTSLDPRPPASARLRSASIASRYASGTPSVTAALIETMLYDPNVNVRLAAVDALLPIVDEPGVLAALETAADTDGSPLVRSTVADLLGRDTQIEL